MNKAARVLVIYYSRTGNTEAMAKAVVKGVEKEGVAVDLKRVDYATTYDVMAADAFAFGSPCHYAYMAGTLKEFFDRLLEPEVLKKIYLKPAAAFACNGEKDGGKEALLSIKRILYNYLVLSPIGDRNSIVCKGEPDKAKLEECESLGVMLAQAAVLTEGNQKGTESQ